jgi:hypothetical protein
VCEGRETERNYFDKLKREDAVTSRLHVTVKKGKGGSRLQIVQEAVDRKNEPGKDYDEAWCVMDVERLDTEDARKDVASAVELARQNGITLCLSNPAFEVWLLAHFLRSSQHFNGCDAVIQDLDKHWERAFRQPYAKNDEHIYEKLASRTSAALENAKDVREKDHGGKEDTADCNSSTEVYRLVGKLLGR